MAESKGPQQLALAKIKLLLARERELNALRQEYQRYQQWNAHVRSITAALSGLENQRQALQELVQHLVAGSSYEFAAAVFEGDLFHFGVAPEAPDVAAIRKMTERIVTRRTSDIDIAVDEARPVRWLMGGAVHRPGTANEVEFTVFVGRTQRTMGYYPPPWDLERVLFEQLVATVAHVFTAVEFRSKVVERSRELDETNRKLEEVVHTQRALLEEMSTPLIPISDEMLVLPLIGRLDAARAQQVLETALEGARRHGAKVVIVDVTGMRNIDTNVASTLVTAASALRMLGVQAILTGVRAEVAQSLVNQDLDLRRLVSRSTLQDGIVYGMRLIRAL